VSPSCGLPAHPPSMRPQVLLASRRPGLSGSAIHRSSRTSCASVPDISDKSCGPERGAVGAGSGPWPVSSRSNSSTCSTVGGGVGRPLRIRARNGPRIRAASSSVTPRMGALPRPPLHTSVSGSSRGGARDVHPVGARWRIRRRRGPRRDCETPTGVRSTRCRDGADHRTSVTDDDAQALSAPVGCVLGARFSTAQADRTQEGGRRSARSTTIPWQASNSF
jgi:hypothetical protein